MNNSSNANKTKFPTLPLQAHFVPAKQGYKQNQTEPTEKFIPYSTSKEQYINWDSKPSNDYESESSDESDESKGTAPINKFATNNQYTLSTESSNGSYPYYDDNYEAKNLTNPISKQGVYPDSKSDRATLNEIERKAAESKICHDLIDLYFKNKEPPFPWTLKSSDYTERQLQFMDRAMAFLGTRLIMGFAVYGTEVKFHEKATDAIDIVFFKKELRGSTEIHIYELVDWKMMRYSKPSLSITLKVMLYMYYMMQKLQKETSSKVEIHIIGGYLYTENGLFMRVNYADHQFDKVFGRYIPVNYNDLLSKGSAEFFDFDQVIQKTEQERISFQQSLGNSKETLARQYQWDSMMMNESEFVFPVADPDRNPVIGGGKYGGITIIELITNMCYRLKRKSLSSKFVNKKIMKGGKLVEVAEDKCDITNLPELCFWMLGTVYQLWGGQGNNWENIRFYINKYVLQSTLNPSLTKFFQIIRARELSRDIYKWTGDDVVRLYEDARAGKVTSDYEI